MAVPLEEITPPSLREMDRAGLLAAHRQAHNWYAEHFEGTTRNTADGLSREDVVNAHLFAVREMAERGIRHGAEDELDEVSGELGEKGLPKPFSSPGGKDNWLPVLLKRIPPHKTYVEPYAGGASLFWAKEPSEREVLCDIDADIMETYRFLKGGTDADFAWMRRQKWEWSPGHFQRLKARRPGSQRAAAYRHKYLSLFSRQDAGEHIAPTPRARNYTGESFLHNLEGYRERLKGVALIAGDALKVVDRYDAIDTFFYCDPPWKKVGAGVGWGSFDEEAFIDAVCGLKGAVLISYQGEFDLGDGWRSYSFTRSGGGIAEPTRQQLYWNYGLGGRKEGDGDIVLVPNFVSEVGGSVEHPGREGDTDFVVRLADSPTTHSLLDSVYLLLRKRLDPEKRGLVHLLPAPEGPHGRHIPRYDLVLRRRQGEEAVDADKVAVLALTLLGVGAQDSPRFAPAGLLVERGGARVMLDGGIGPSGRAVPEGKLDAWLATDERGELMPALRRLAKPFGVEPAAESFEAGGLTITRREVVHTSHPAYAYEIEAGGVRAVWAPEFYRFPRWAAGADIMFAEASGWERPIEFAGGVGGHMAALDVARAAERAGVKRLVLAHIGRPTIEAMGAGEKLPFGEFGRDGQEFRLGAGGKQRTLKPIARYTPMKPLMAGFTDFTDIDELWENWGEEALAEAKALYVSPKVDGFRTIIQRAGGDVSIRFEDLGRELGKSEELRPIRDGLRRDLIVEGELQVRHKGRFVARPEIASFLAGKLGGEPVVFLYEALHWDGEDIHDRPFSENLGALRQAGRLGPALVTLPQVRVESKAELLRAAKRLAGWKPDGSGPAVEGVVVRKADMTYRFGASSDYAKTKRFAELKFKVTGVNRKENGYTYDIALRGGDGDVAMGSTFVSKERLADEGDTLNVTLEELLLHPDGSISTGKPTPLGVDRSRPAYTVEQAIDIARRFGILKEFVGEKLTPGEGTGRPVPPTGPRTARLAVVGDGPGRIEEREGEPLVGPSGKFLKKLLEEMGMDPGEIYWANVYRRRDAKPDDELTGRLGRRLTQELDRLPNLKAILAISEIAGRGLAGAEGPMAGMRHGDYKTPGGTPIVVTYHPSAILRSGQRKSRLYPAFREDIGKVVTLAGIKARHRRDQCMECSEPPTIEVLWAEGMAHAWFCDSHFKKWESEHPGDIVKTRKIDDVASRHWPDGKQRLGEDEPRGEVARRFWEQNWWKSFPKSGSGRFVYHHHWRGLSEEEAGLDEPALLKSEHSVHGDLRFQIDDRSLWGFTVFLGKVEDVRGGRDVYSLPQDDKLQGSFKLHQPIQWLTIARRRPYVSEPGEIGATAQKFSKFFEADSGTYQAGVWREHFLEVFLKGRKFKGRFLIQFAPVAAGRRVWLIARPGDQRPYAETHDLEEVLAELRRKRQGHLLWAKPGERPRLIDVTSARKGYEGCDSTPYDQRGLPHRLGGEMDEPEYPADDWLEDEDEMESAEDKAGRRLGRGALDRLGKIVEELKSILGWASYDGEPQLDLSRASGFKVLRDDRWVAFSSNAFRDRDGEIFSTKALADAVAYGDRTGNRGDLLLFHVPAAKVGTCDFQAVVGRFLVESGAFDGSAQGRCALQYFKEKITDDFGMSIGYRYSPGDRGDGVYDWLQIIERSILPAEAAANAWTRFTVGGEEMELDRQKKEMLFEILGPDLGAKVVEQAERQTKALEEAVDFKAVGDKDDEETQRRPRGEKGEGEKAKHLGEILGAIGRLAGRIDDAQLKEAILKQVKVGQDALGKYGYGYPGPDKDRKEAEEMEADEDQGAGAEEPAAAALEGAIRNAVAPLAEAIAKLQEGSKAIEQVVKELQRSDDERMAELIEPKAKRAVSEKARPSESDENVVDDEEAKELAATGAERTDGAQAARPYVEQYLLGKRPTEE